MEVKHPSWDHARWNALSDTQQHKEDFNWRLAREFSMEPGKLQYKWRALNFAFPQAFPWKEVEYALLDAFINEGAATAWCGDGSSCATQIVKQIWDSANKELQKRDQEIDFLRKELQTWTAGL